MKPIYVWDWVMTFLGHLEWLLEKGFEYWGQKWAVIFCHFALSPSLNCFWEVYYSVSPNICIFSLLKTFISCVIKHVTLQPSSRDEIFFTRFANPHPKSGFSPVWLSIWFLRVQCNKIYLSQTLQYLEQRVDSRSSSLHDLFNTGSASSCPENGFSPVWRCLWFLRVLLRINYNSHSSQFRIS